MSRLNVNSIVDALDSGPPELTYGAIIAANSTITAAGNVNLTGISTISTLSIATFNTPSITASQFIGNGSQLSGLPVTNASKVIALKMILDPLPFRA